MLNEAYKDDKVLFREVEHPEMAIATIDAVEDAARFRADTVLGELTKPLEIKGERNTVTRDKFIKKTDAKWAPPNKETTLLASEGLVASISEVFRYAPKDKKDASIKARYITAVESANNAHDAMNLLHPNRIVDPTLAAFPKAKEIKDNHLMVAEIANFIADRRSLDDYKWPQDSDEQIEIIGDYIRHSGPAMTEKLHKMAFHGRRAENNFWSDQEKKARYTTTINRMLEDPAVDLPKIKLNSDSGQVVDDKKLLELSEKLAAARAETQKRTIHIIGEDSIPEEAVEIAAALQDPTSNESIRVRNLTEGSGASEYLARLSVVGVKGAGKAVPMVKQSRFKGSNVPVRGSNQRLTADTPTQAHEAKSTKPEYTEIINRTPEEILIANEGIRALGGVLHGQKPKDSKEQ